MARLCRFYVSGAGNASARFNPLIIDLRDRHQWKPQNAIIWLRNGGGKTTLISLFYCIFIPKISDFLGMKNGKGAKLPDFLRDDELAIIATEWQPSDPEAPRRTVGVVMLKTSRDLKRLFFSFNETKTYSFSFDSIPARGLAEAAPSFDAFKERLNDAMREYPAIELVHTEIQTVWIQHLDSLGLDTELFRTHLIMNSQEGGAADIFKIKNPEDFVKKFLELAYDESSTEEIERNLQGFKEKRESAPHYQKSIEFGESLVRLLTPFAADVAKRNSATKEQSDLAKEAAAARFSVQTRRQTLAGEISSLDIEIRDYERALDDLGKEQRRQNNFSKGYQLLGKRLKVEETKLALEQAQNLEKNAALELSVLKAAKEFANVRALRSEHSALVAERERLHEDLRPQLTELRILGAKLNAAWNRRTKDLQAAFDLAKEQLASANSQIETLTNAQTNLSSLIMAAEKDRESARKAIRAYEEAHRGLRKSGAILEDEKAGDALARLKSETWKLTNSLETLRVTLGQLNARTREFREKHVDLSKSAADARSLAEKVEGRLLDEEVRRTTIERLPIVDEVVVGGSVQLRNPFLLNRLEEIADEAQSKLIQIGVQGADDFRDDLSLDKFGLLAPSADVEALVAQLREQGINSAVPAYHWLAEHYSTEQALNLCESNPSIASGVLIQTSSDFERARLELKKSQIRVPIVLFNSSPSPEKGKQSEVLVVTPVETGMFSKDDALKARTAIDARREERANRQGELEARRASAQSAATKIKDHLKQFSEELVNGWTEELEEARKQAAELDAEVESVAAEIGETEGEIDEKTQLTNHQHERRNIVGKQETEVSNFHRDHESGIDGNRAQLAEFSRQFDELSRSFGENKIRISELQEKGKVYQSAVTEHDFKCRDARKLQSLVPQEYIGDEEELVNDVGRPEDLEPGFNAAVSNYKGLLKASDLDGQITAKSAEIQKAEDSLERASRDVPLQEIEPASEAADIDSEIAEQETTHGTLREKRAVARQVHDEATRELPADPDFKSPRLTDEARDPQPSTSEECHAVAAEYESKSASLSAKIEETRETKAVAAGRHHQKELEEERYKGLFGKLPEVPEAFTGHQQFTEIPDQDEQLITGLATRISRNASELAKAESSIDRRYSTQISPLILNSDYDSFRIDFRDRLKQLHKEDVAVKAEALIEAIEIAVAACKDDLEHEDQHRRIIVEQLDDIVQRSSRLLAQASEVSKMPAESGAWAHHPFLRIVVPKKSDKAERAHHLNTAMQGWYDSNSIPQGHALAFHCLLAVCGTKSITVKMLKPEYVATSTPHDIIDMMKFSDGEKLTAAILLYCVLVRLRARQRAKTHHYGGADSGLLLLDNPFGKATLYEFVELQVNVARLMGVQLVYATGIGADSALKHFPHIVRLKNSVRSRSNGDRYVTPEQNDHVVDGITLGVRAHVSGRN